VIRIPVRDFNYDLISTLMYGCELNMQFTCIAAILLLCHKVVVGSIVVLDDDAWGPQEIENGIHSCLKGHSCVRIDGTRSSSDDEDAEEPCSICGRRYYHEHK
jgi:hypothetical protein